MSFYSKLIHILYPEYIPPKIFIYPMKNKYSLFIQLALQNQKRLNIFYLINKEERHKYYKIYKIQQQLSLFVTIVKHKYAKVFNEINLYGDKIKNKCIKIIENDTIYKFDFFEMIKIIKKKLYYHSHYFLLPLFPTNPYTNTPFKIHTLYNIFFQLLHSSYLIPIGIRVFFNVNFDLIRFVDRFSYNIKLDIMNEDYCNLSLNEKYTVMNEMCIYFKKFIFLNVSNDILYNIFKVNVKDYYKASHMPSWISKIMFTQIKKCIMYYHKTHPNIGKIQFNIFTGDPIVCL